MSPAMVQLSCPSSLIWDQYRRKRIRKILALFSRPFERMTLLKKVAMPAQPLQAQQALADYDNARADYVKFLSMSPPDDRSVSAAMVAMDEAHIRFKQAMGDHDAPTHLRPV